MLTNKVAIITGGGTGIGRACALRLAREGADIVINFSRSKDDAEQTKADIESIGRKAITCQASVTDDAAVRAMIKTTTDTFGRIDILINNAGTTHFVPLNDLEGLQDKFWFDIMDVNVVGMFRCSRAAAPSLKANKGCIVNITSVAGLTGMGSSIAYAASKAAAISLTKSLARVLAPEVRVNSIAPGIVLTRWVADHQDHVKRYGENTPLGRVANPEDVAEIAYSLVANAGLVTGQTVVVDGGAFL
jgi:3-oxoacyl-[acyl-carrier protein] reductase